MNKWGGGHFDGWKQGQTDSPGLPFLSRVALPAFIEQYRNPSIKEGTSAGKLLSSTASSLGKSIQREKEGEKTEIKKKKEEQLIRNNPIMWWGWEMLFKRRSVALYANPAHYFCFFQVKFKVFKNYFCQKHLDNQSVFIQGVKWLLKAKFHPF